jgi:phosphatidyl-myo-inositol alpha-mannosyltransferase
MRVAMVCPYDWSTPGGVQAQVEGLANALQRAGLSVVVLAPVTASPASTAAFDFELVGVGKSVSIAANGSRAPVAPTPAAMARTVKALRRAKADVVHVHEPLVPGPSLAALTAGPRPMLGTFHRAGADALYRAEGRALRGVVHRLDAFVAVSDAARKTAGEVLGSSFGDMLVIPNGVDLQRYTDPSIRLNGLRAGTSSRDQGSETGRTGHRAVSPLTVVFVGRHEERKGLVVLLEAFGRLRRDASSPDVRDARLSVVGDGPATSQLKERFGGDDAISWLGAVDDTEKARSLAAADVFVAPSLRGESFGVVLLEAMAAGAPVIASDLPGYRLAAGEAARFVPPGDESALASALAAVLGKAEERERLRALAAERVRGFSMESIAERYAELYGSLAGQCVG